MDDMNKCLNKYYRIGIFYLIHSKQQVCNTDEVWEGSPEDLVKASEPNFRRVRDIKWNYTTAT